MPRELVLMGPRNPVLREYEERPLRPSEIRVRTVFSAEKHGTMMVLYRGASPFEEKYYDERLGVFIRRGRRESIYPMPLGNMSVGVVTEVGESVSRFKVGDRVFGYLPIRETHTVREDGVWPAPPDLSDKELVCVDPATVALMAVREGGVRIGERVAVFGLGAIGLLAVQMCKASGAIFVAGVDLIDKRLKLAEKYGADCVLNPADCDVGLELKKMTSGGVDVALEITGSYRALHEAIRSTHFGGRVVPVSWYHGEATGLNLGEEFHVNRITMLSGARVESEPYREYPLWDRRRVYDTVVELFRRGALDAEEIVWPVVRFEEVVEAYRMVDERPGEVIKLGVTYG